MSARRTERLLNLVICLKATTKWLTKEQIRLAVPQYEQCDSDVAFDRMFERDKEDLRELGIPLITGTHDAWFEDEVGYRIDPERYALPDLEFTPEELAILGLASRLWAQASLSGAASSGLLKLRALGVSLDAEPAVGVEPGVRAPEPCFERLYEATCKHLSVSFEYRDARGEVGTRRLQPWQIAIRRGYWYVRGFDLDREEPRSFRLSRVTGKVSVDTRQAPFEAPDETDLAALTWGVDEARDARQATVAVAPGTCLALRARAGAGPEAPSITLEIGQVAWLAAELAGYGASAVVLEPDDLREAVIQRLSAVVSAQASAVQNSAVQNSAVQNSAVQNSAAGERA